MSYLTLGNQLGNLLQFLFFIYFARQFGEHVVGQYSFALSFTFISTLFADLGLSAYLIREIARDRSGSRQLFGRCLSLRVFALSLCTLFACATILVFSERFSAETIKIVFLLGLYHIFFSVADIYLGEFKGHDRMGLVALLDIFLKLIIASLGVLLILFGYSYSAVLSCFPLASLSYLALSMFFSFHSFGHTRLRFTNLALKPLFLTILPFTLTLLFAHAFYHLDVLMLAILQDNKAVGIFTAANRVVLAVMTVLVFVHTALLPNFSTLYVKSRSELVALSKQVLRYLLLIGLPIGTGLFATSEKVITLLFTSSFESSISVLRILSWTLAFGFAAAPFSVLLTAVNRQREKAYVLGICLIVNFVVNLFLIPTLSFNGAATAKLVTEALHLILMAYLVSRYLAPVFFCKIFVKPALSCLLMYVFIRFVYQWNLIALIVASMLVYLLFLAALRAYDANEIAFIKTISSRIFLNSKLLRTYGSRK